MLVFKPKTDGFIMVSPRKIALMWLALSLFDIFSWIFLLGDWSVKMFDWDKDFKHPNNKKRIQILNFMIYLVVDIG